MRLIDADELKKAFNSWKNMDDYYHNTNCDDIPFTEAFDLIDNAPTVNPELILARANGKYSSMIASLVERPQGVWNEIQAGLLVCPFCGATPHKQYKSFCAKCGADMRGGKEE